MTTPETDPIRRKILTAMDRLFAGKPQRSTGRLNVSQLAAEAGLPRWHLTHQHVDLKDLFQARIRADGATPAPFRGTAAALDDLEKKHRALLADCAGLEARIKLYAQVIQVLSIERATTDRGHSVTDISSHQRSPRHPGRRN